MSEKPYEGWCILELLGHRRLAGYVTAVEVAGHGMLRLDVPDEPGPTGQEYVVTQFYSPNALYCLTPTTEEVARRVATGARPTPVARWELEPGPAADLCECGHERTFHQPQDALDEWGRCTDEDCDCSRFRLEAEDLPF